MKDLELYKKHSKVPVQFTKEIQAGRMKGKTDISPQWRIECLTDTFGLCGFGWKYEILSVEFKEFQNQIAVFVSINLYIKKDDVWSDGIFGSGGSMFVAQEKNGAFVSDECIKMATTDALSVCCKQIGIASDVYLGLGGKYTQPQPPQQQYTQPQQKPVLKAGSKEFDNAFEKLNNGTITIEKIESYYTLTPDVKKLLTK